MHFTNYLSNKNASWGDLFILLHNPNSINLCWRTTLARKGRRQRIIINMISVNKYFHQILIIYIRWTVIPQEISTFSDVLYSAVKVLYSGFI